jgi:penicillin-binding protein A
MFYRSVTDEQVVRIRRARPVIALALVAFAIGAIVGSGGGASPSKTLTARFVAAWSRGDYASMYGDVDDATKHALSAEAFAAAYAEAMRTATATSIRVLGKPRSADEGLLAVPMRVDTRLFGTLTLDVRLRVVSDTEGDDAIAWSRSLAFPGVRPGETLTRETTLPPRAKLLARDGSVLAEGNPTEAGTRSSPLGGAASAVIGEVGPLPAAGRAALEAQGVPANAIVGTSGLERALDAQLRGRPGGELLAGRRVLASAVPVQASAVRTTISPVVQQAAVEALGSQLGGVVALEPTSGQILAVAGIGINSVQPPGSTFKMVTLTGVLNAHIATPATVFPYATYATLDGVKLSNANGEECGGSLELAFAVSCNSVFSPLGVKLGATRLVAMAERFGFNHPPGIEGAVESTLPAASEIQGELDVGSTAIGQGQVQASALEMAIVAASIADGGRRPRPTFTPATTARGSGAYVTSAAVARTVRKLMIEVVRKGTGTSAAIPGVTVAGKTGTAELKSECTSSGGESESSETGHREPEAGSGCAGAENEASNTDAWFASFAPAVHPRVAVCVMLVKDGAGGDTAAPVAREVLEAGLKATS